MILLAVGLSVGIFPPAFAYLAAKEATPSLSEFLAAGGGLLVGLGAFLGVLVTLRRDHLVAIAKAEENAEQALDDKVALAVASEREHCDRQIAEIGRRLAVIEAHGAQQETLVTLEQRRASHANNRAWRMRNLAEVKGVDADLVERVWIQAANLDDDER